MPREVANQTTKLECPQGIEDDTCLVSPAQERTRSNSPVRIELKAKETMVVAMILAGYNISTCTLAHPEYCCNASSSGHSGYPLTSSPISLSMMFTRIWKNGTASIIIDPLPPGKMDPPRVKISCEMMHLEDQSESVVSAPEGRYLRHKEHGYTERAKVEEVRVCRKPE